MKTEHAVAEFVRALYRKQLTNQQIVPRRMNDEDWLGKRTIRAFPTRLKPNTCIDQLGGAFEPLLFHGDYEATPSMERCSQLIIRPVLVITMDAWLRDPRKILSNVGVEGIVTSITEVHYREGSVIDIREAIDLATRLGQSVRESIQDKVRIRHNFETQWVRLLTGDLAHVPRFSNPKVYLGQCQRLAMAGAT